MPTGARHNAGLALWVAALLFVPLPYLQLADGAVPVARFAMLAGIAALYGAIVDPGGVVWMVAGMLLLHALGYALLLAVAVWLIRRLLRRRLTGPMGTVIVVVGIVIANLVPVYHTPFDDAAAWTTWLGLWQ